MTKRGNGFYKPSPIKPRYRRTKEEIERLKVDILHAIEAEHPLTIRQVFYRLVARGLIDKTQREYQNVVVRLIGKMRRECMLPFHRIVDNTRWMRKPDTYDSLEQMLEITQDSYRRAIWNEQDVQVEVWCESDSIAGVLYPITAKWDVPLMVCRGFPSITFLYGAANAIVARYQQSFKRTKLYYFGDHDPSGLQIDKTVCTDLRDFCNGNGRDIDRNAIVEAFIGGVTNGQGSVPRSVESDFFDFERVAVTNWQIEETNWQIEEWNLPSRPPKKGDRLAKGREDMKCVELEAIPPDELRQLCENCVTQHIDRDRLESLLLTEAAERETLAGIVENFS